MGACGIKWEWDKVEAKPETVAAQRVADIIGFRNQEARIVKTDNV